MRSLDIDRAMLITHTDPSPQAQKSSERSAGNTQTYAELIQQVVDLAGVSDPSQNGWNGGI